MIAIELLAKATRDAATADALHRDRAFLSELRRGGDVTSRFEVATARDDGRDRRAVPRSWTLRIPLRALRARPIP